MTGPTNLKELARNGDFSRGNAKAIAREIFDGSVWPGSTPEGYVMTLAKFDDLTDDTQSFIIKAIFASTIVNVLDTDHSNADMMLADEDDEETAEGDSLTQAH
jgi:hypothetical protein